MPEFKLHIVQIAFIFWLLSCEKDDSSTNQLNLNGIFIGETELKTDGSLTENLPVDRPITLIFSSSVDRTTAETSIRLHKNEIQVNANLNYSNDDKNISVFPSATLDGNTVYTIEITNELKGANGESFTSTEVSFKTQIGDLKLNSIRLGDQLIDGSEIELNVPLDFLITFEFNHPIDRESFENATQISGGNAPGLNYSYSEEDKKVEVAGSSQLDYFRKYTFTLSDDLVGSAGESFSGFTTTFYSEADETPKFPEISDEELMTKVQEQTFRYFWDFAHPVSGLARERNTSGDLVTIGGSGFGVMAILVGVERGFITRQEAISRLTTIIDFLMEADRFHGVWPHWMNGITGDVIPFSEKDNGGDLVETAFMIQGLLTVREYLDPNETIEKELIDKITVLWEEVEWDWYTREGENVLYWHWSPTFEWEMNHKIQGYNEALIIYILAASSPTHPIDPLVYENGWARNGDIENGNSFYNIELPMGYDYGGPLFFTHYSFLGLDPRNLSDQYGNYWEQNVNHSLINYSYCINNPKNFAGYSEQCWGLTASDNQDGYSAHSPTNDLGVITPTAAISSIPYTPEESLLTLKYFYYTLGDRLWKEYGFIDAFNVTMEWYADSFLAIDQGPIIIMIENYRSGMLWDLFMTCPDINNGLDKLSFNY